MHALWITTLTLRTKPILQATTSGMWVERPSTFRYMCPTSSRSNLAYSWPNSLTTPISASCIRLTSCRRSIGSTGMGHVAPLLSMSQTLLSTHPRSWVMNSPTPFTTATCLERALSSLLPIGCRCSQGLTTSWHHSCLTSSHSLSQLTT